MYLWERVKSGSVLNIFNIQSTINQSKILYALSPDEPREDWCRPLFCLLIYLFVQKCAYDVNKYCEDQSFCVVFYNNYFFFKFLLFSRSFFENGTPLC